MTKLISLRCSERVECILFRMPDSALVFLSNSVTCSLIFWVESGSHVAAGQLGES